MATTLSNSVLNIVKAFSPEDLAAFMADFEKLQKPVAKCKPKKIKPISVFPTKAEMENYIKNKYCNGNGIQAQDKLA